MSKEYAIYDMKDYEQLVYSGSMNEVSKFLNTTSECIWSYISHKKAGRREGYIQRRYDVLEVVEEEVEETPKKSMQEIWQEIIQAFTIEKHNFIEYDPFKDELKRRMNMVIVGEEWKKIEEFHYSLSNYGRVRNDLNNKIKERRMHKGIMQVDIYEDGKRYTVSLKRAVANYFIRELQPGEKVKCIDGDGNNLYYKNLKIVCN